VRILPAIAVILALASISPATEPLGMEALVRNYYDGVMTGRAIGWDIEMRRLPELRGQQQIVSIAGEERTETPRGTRICWLEIREGNRNSRLPVTVRIKPVERVPVALLDIEPRTPLMPGMVEWQEIPTEKYGATHIATENDLRGSWAKVRIPAGTVVTGRRIEPMPRVVFGSPVKLIIRIGKIEAVAEGKALEDGRIGEKIRVLNLASGFRLRGRVASDGTITIE